MLAEDYIKKIKEGQSRPFYRYFDELREWHRECMNIDADYIVFVGNQSYRLASAMEILDEGWDKQFLSETAMITELITERNNFIEQIKAHKFPKILICNVIPFDGGEILNFLHDLEKNIYINTDMEQYDVQDILKEFVTIRVFLLQKKIKCLKQYERQKSFYVQSAYLRDAKYKIKDDLNECNELNNNIEQFIINAGVFTAPYIYQESISKEECSKIIDKYDTFHEAIFQDVVEYIKTDFLSINDTIQAAFSIRIIVGFRENFYYVAPYVFLPAMNIEESRRLCSAVAEKFREQDRLLGERIYKWLLSLLDRYDRIAFSENILMILNYAILYEFLKENNIRSRDKESQEEAWKFLKNRYYKKGKDWKTFSKIIENLQKNPAVNSQNDVCKIIKNACTIERYVAKIGKTHANKTQVCERVENYIYGLMCRKEDSLKRGCYKAIITENIEELCLTCRKIFENMDEESIRSGFAYMLTMADAGSLSISPFVPSYATKIMGYRQYIAANQQTFLIIPLRILEFVPMLALAEEFCWQFNLDFYKNLNVFFNSKWNTLTEDEFHKIEEICKVVKNTGYTIGDWYGYFYNRMCYCKVVDWSDEVERKQFLQWQYAFEKKKNKNTEQYKEFMLYVKEDDKYINLMYLHRS